MLMKENALMADASLKVIDDLVELNQAIGSSRKLKAMTAPRRMDVRVTDALKNGVIEIIKKIRSLNQVMMAIAVLMVVKDQLMAENVDADKARGALMMMNQAKKTITREKRTTVI